LIIAVDGPAASGKGTLARGLARHYGLTHLDTGAIYRSIARIVLDSGGDPENSGHALAAARRFRRAMFADDELRSDKVSRAASLVAAHPEVRAEVIGIQRSIAHTPPGAVLDGRDIGTVVCPEADIKFYVTASAEERARRRRREALARGEPADYAAILAEILERDERDRTRKVAPMRPSPEAHLLDTTSLDIEAAFQAARRIIDGRQPGRT
jgi:cytidylate kinase